MRTDSLLGGVFAALVFAVAPGNAARVSPSRSFEANRGQVSADVGFVARGRGLDLAVTADGAVIAPRDGACAESVRFRLEGADAGAEMEGLDPLPEESHYLRGADPSCWTTEVPHFARVRCNDVLPGVDIVWHVAPDGAIEHDFVLAPGTRPEVLTIRFEGARSLRVDPGGALVIVTPGGAELSEHAPVAYQETGEGIQPVVAAWVISGELQAGFVVGPHDGERELVIDPALSYSSYLGGSYDDEPQRVGVDSAGNLYVAGYTDSPDFPLVSPIATYQDFADVFVTKIDATTGLPLYSTYLGGSGDDVAFGLAVHPDGSVVVVGETDSDDFPLVAAVQPAYGGAWDGFVVAIDPTGSALEYATYLGGGAADTAFGVALDAASGVLVAGRTESTDFPVMNAFQPAFGGGFFDAFLARLDPGGATISYATYLGGSDDDEAFDVAVDSAGRAHLTGDTLSDDFPLQGARQGSRVGFGADAFVSRFTQAGDALELSTYHGGTEDDWGAAIAVDGTGAILVGGTTLSSDFPTRGALFGPSDGERGFVTRFLVDGSDFVYSTCFGGSGGETLVALAGDASGGAFVAGLTSSTDLPNVFGVQPFPGGGVYDGFVAKLDPSGSRLACSGYFGGSGQDSVVALAAIDANNFVLAGWTDSSDLPIVMAYQAAYSGGVADGFVARIGCATAPFDLGNTLWLTKDAGGTDHVLTWIDDAQAASYRVYAEIDKAAPFATVAALATSGVTGATLPLSPETLVLYRVSAGNCCGEGSR